MITHLSISHRMLGVRESGNVPQYYRKDQDLSGNTSTIPDSQIQVKEVKKRPQAECGLKEGPVKRIRPSPIGGSGSDLATFSHGLPPPVKAALVSELCRPRFIRPACVSNQNTLLILRGY